MSTLWETLTGDGKMEKQSDYEGADRKCRADRESSGEENLAYQYYEKHWQDMEKWRNKVAMKKLIEKSGWASEEVGIECLLNIWEKTITPHLPLSKARASWAVLELPTKPKTAALDALLGTSSLILKEKKRGRWRQDKKEKKKPHTIHLLSFFLVRGTNCEQ